MKFILNNNLDYYIIKITSWQRGEESYPCCLRSGFFTSFIAIKHLKVLLYFLNPLMGFIVYL